jgi:hypothetical protein
MEHLDSSLLALYFYPLRLRDFRFCILPDYWLLAGGFDSRLLDWVVENRLLAIHPCGKSHCANAASKPFGMVRDVEQQLNATVQQHFVLGSIAQLPPSGRWPNIFADRRRRWYEQFMNSLR